MRRKQPYLQSCWYSDTLVAKTRKAVAGPQTNRFDEFSHAFPQSARGICNRGRVNLSLRLGNETVCYPLFKRGLCTCGLNEWVDDTGKFHALCPNQKTHHSKWFNFGPLRDTQDDNLELRHCGPSSGRRVCVSVF